MQHAEDSYRYAPDSSKEGQGVLWTSLPADLLTPVGAFLRLVEMIGGDERYIMLLESVEGGTSRGRYSVIALLPDMVWRCHGGQVHVNIQPQKNPDAFETVAEAPLSSLERLIDESQMSLPEGLPPMTAGVFGYLGYDMVRQVEHLPDAPQDDLHLPESVLMRPSLFAIFDNVKDELVLASPVRPHAFAGGRKEAAQRLRQALAALAMPVQDSAPLTALPAGEIEPVSNMKPGRFLALVKEIKDYIAAGDAFQVVPSQRFSAPFDLPPFALYRALRRVNPAPFLFYLGLQDFALVGSSPEILVRLTEDRTVTIHPLAGTRRRGVSREEDMALEKELLSDPKERAEHLMLIDLARNDVGRVCEIGSVRVTESFVVERFSHVMHITSNVEGRLRPGLKALDALMAGMPAGTMTGAPKIRAMEIIDEMEPTRRATYAGCIGYFGAQGAMDTCIGLRMAVVKDGKMHVQAGCGVVADSDPQLEYEETRHKARALFRAAEEAVRMARRGGEA